MGTTNSKAGYSATGELLSSQVFFGKHYQAFQKEEVKIILDFLAALGLIHAFEQEPSQSCKFTISEKHLQVLPAIKAFLTREENNCFSDDITSRFILEFCATLDGPQKTIELGSHAFIDNFVRIFKSKIDPQDYLKSFFYTHETLKQYILTFVSHYAAARWPQIKEDKAQADLFLEDATVANRLAIEILYIRITSFMTSFSHDGATNVYSTSRLHLPTRLVVPIPIGAPCNLLLEPAMLFFLASQLPYFTSRGERSSTTELHLAPQWTLLFSSEQGGSLSWTTFVDSIVHAGPQLFLVKDSDGYIFGGLMDKSPECQPHFQGDDTAAVFSLYPKPAIGSPTGYNNHFFYLNDGMHSFPSGIVPAPAPQLCPDYL
jgi:hypothetical protein